MSLEKEFRFQQERLKSVEELFNKEKQFNAEKAKANPFDKSLASAEDIQRAEAALNSRSPAYDIDLNERIAPKPPENPYSASHPENAFEYAANQEQRRIEEQRRAKAQAAKAQAQSPASASTPVTSSSSSNRGSGISGAHLPHLAVGPSGPSPSASAAKVLASSKGHIVSGVAGGVISTAVGIAQGEDPIRASFGGVGATFGGIVGSVLGTGVGALLTLPAGGVGATVLGFAGGTAGAFAGEKAAKSLYDKIFGSNQKSMATPVLPKGTGGYVRPIDSFLEGNVAGVQYRVRWRRQYSAEVHGYVTPWYEGEAVLCYGPIMGYLSFLKISPMRADGGTNYVWDKGFRARDIDGKSVDFFFMRTSGAWSNEPQKQRAIAGATNSVFEIISIERVGGKGAVLMPTGLNYPHIYLDDYPAKSLPEPLTTKLNFPVGVSPESSVIGGIVSGLYTPTSPIDNPASENKDRPTKVLIPPGSRVIVGDPASGGVTTTTVGSKGDTINVPNSNSINAGTISLPSSGITLKSPANSPVTINIPGLEPIVVDPTGKAPAKGATNSILEPKTFTPTTLKDNPLTPDIKKDLKKDNQTTSPKTPEKILEKTPEVIPDLPKGLDVTDPNVQLILVTLTSLLNPIKDIQKNTTPNAIASASATGTCSTLQPGGCMTGLANNAASANANSQANGSILNGANLAANGANHALLNVLDTKLGPQMTGGISGALGRMSKFLGLDRILNAINFAANLHNAAMLTSSLKTTLLETISSVLNATELLQTSEGENIDLNQVFNNGIDAAMSLIMGEDGWASMKTTWKKYNTIYRAGANVINAVQSIMNSIGNAIETIAERGSKVANALRSAGVVSENAYEAFSEKVNAKIGPFMSYQKTVGNTVQVLELINEIAENVVEGQQGVIELQKANKEFVEALEKADKKKGEENKIIAEEVKKMKENATKNPTGEDEDGLLSFLTDID